MLPEESITLCRICLGSGAQIPIFDSDDTGDIYAKLSTCLQEKVEDIEGFPRYICSKCKDKLYSACDFIATYKDSYKILLYGIAVVKEEKLEYDNDYKDDLDDDDDDDMFDRNNLIDPEKVEVKTKLEPVDSDDDQQLLIELVKPLKLKIKTKKFKNADKVPKQPRKPRTPKIVKRKATTVATCILEGNFTWNGERWCSSKEPSNIQFTDPETLQRIKRKRPIALEKLIKKKSKKPKEKIAIQKLCDLCGEVFKNRDRLLYHRKMVHFPKKLKCPNCPRVCKSMHYLNNHIKRKHGKKDFVCNECGKEYAFLNEMNAHIKKVHKKIEFPKKVFACSLCDKTYKCQKSVTIHERSVHTGERPAVCTVCNSTFFHEEYLKEHMRLHTGETPFKCPVCGRGYAQQCNMKSHIKQHRISELDRDVMSRIKPAYLRLMKP